MHTTLDFTRSVGSPTSLTQYPSLIVLWSAAEPWRIGEMVELPNAHRAHPAVLGRGDQGGARRVRFIHQRPALNVVQPALEDEYISRVQLNIAARGRTGFVVENVGRCPMLINGQRTNQGELRVGDVLTLRRRLMLLCVSRPRVLPALRDWTLDLHPFGQPDVFGLVGESPATWALREQLALVAPRNRHVLLLGESGTGKELAAQIIHGLSQRNGPLISRNAATLPEGLIDAELFGNIQDYPNSGMPARPGLIGSASGGSLMLDEIGELPTALQAHLLRVLDDGEYQPLGASRSKKADIRLIAATNRAGSALKPDLLARLTLSLQTPPLRERREDIPLLIRHLFERIRREDPDIGQRFYDPELGAVRISPGLIFALVRQPLPLNVRQLDQHLWEAILAAPGDRLRLVSALKASLKAPEVEAARAPAEISADQVQEALKATGGVLAETWKVLGLKNRYVLRRLMRKYREQGVQFERGSASPGPGLQSDSTVLQDAPGEREG
ncbi:MAG: sigma 54-interacting transcriptional regulator [Myxococcota bacterium]